MLDKKIINKIRLNGLCVIEDFYSLKECKKLVGISEKIFTNLKKKKREFSKYCQVINSPFQYNKIFFNYIYNKKIDYFMKKLIDEHYVLLNSNIINRQINNEIVSKRTNMGETWHTDSRIIGASTMQPKISYIIVTMLEDFTKYNASTEYVESSHLADLKSINKLLKNKNKVKQLTGKPGSVAIFDSRLLHKGGVSTNVSRWSIYSYYGPWFIKPYFDYNKMLGKKMLKLTTQQKKILHYFSSPPKNDRFRNSTLQFEKYIK